jgi:hypothetical protein
MKPSDQCKAAGLKSLAELSRISGESVQTLNNWHRNKPKLFEIVLKGCLEEKSIVNDKWDNLLKCLFYAPSSPVSAKKALEIKDWWGKVKTIKPDDSGRSKLNK